MHIGGYIPSFIIQCDTDEFTGGLINKKYKH